MADSALSSDLIGELRAAAKAGSRPHCTDLRGLVLRGEDLSGIDLSGACLSDVDLSEANLSGAKLAGANLSGAVLYRANLDHCELLGADLTGAHLIECTARHAGFAHAKMNDAEVFSANLQAATFNSATLIGADFRAADLERARLTDANLQDVNLTRAKMSHVVLTGSNVSGACFNNADLREAHLQNVHGYEKAHWIGVDLRDVNFAGAYLLRRWVADSNYLHEFRTRSRASTFFYWLWWVTSDCGRSVSRWFFLNAVLALAFAAVYTKVDIDFGAHQTALSPIYFSVVTLTTLGYGDVLPASMAAQAVAVLQVMLGYVGLGGLLSILSNKLARRAD